MTERRGKSLLSLLALAASAAAAAGFFLPWLRVSVAGRSVIRATGLDLLAGNIALRLPLVGVVKAQGSPSIPLILAAILIAFSLAVPLFLERRRAASLGFGASAAAALLIAGFVAWGIYVHLPLPPEQQSLLQRAAASLVRAGGGPGFWLTIVSLAAASMLHRAAGASAPK